MKNEEREIRLEREVWAVGLDWQPVGCMGFTVMRAIACEAIPHGLRESGPEFDRNGASD